MVPPNVKLVAGFLAVALISSTLGRARADDPDEAIQKVIRLDQRVHIMALEFNEGPSEPADLPDQRVLAAQVLLGLGRTDEATTLLLAVIFRWPQTLAARDATFALADALFEQHDYLSARAYYEKAVSTFTGTKREERALVRLIDLALRSGDFQPVDGYLRLLATPGDTARDPVVAYVKAKVLYYRGHLDEAKRIFASIAPASAYSWPARYFIGTIMVKAGDLDGATSAYEGLLQTAAGGGREREIQDLARLALGRLSYERGRTERATIMYLSIATDSKVFTDGLYELGWTYIRSMDFPRAERAFERLLGLQPDGPQAPELKLLVANLRLRQGALGLARVAFTRVRDELEPTFQRLKAVIVRSQADPVFLELLTSRRLEDLDLATFVPSSARSWVRADPEIERLLTIARDVALAEKGVMELTDTLNRIEGVLTEVDRLDRLALFPDLERARQGSTDALTELVAVRGPFSRRARRLVQPFLSESDAQLLDENAAERVVIERQLETRRSLAGVQAATTAAAGPRMEPLLAAMVRLETPTSTTETIEAWRATPPTEDASARAPRVAARLRQLSGQDLEVEQAALARAGAAEHREADRSLDIVARADAAMDQLLTLDARLDTEANVRMAAVKEVVVARHRDLVVARDKLEVVATDARSLGGGLAQVMYTRVADHLYDLIVRADVGLIDVAWGFKARRSAALQVLVTEKSLEERALEDQLARDEAALSQRLKREAAWARQLPSVTRPGTH
jgi:TolA-binding protein